MERYCRYIRHLLHHRESDLASPGREVELQARQRRRLLGNLAIQQHAQPFAARLRPLRALGIPKHRDVLAVIREVI